MSDTVQMSQPAPQAEVIAFLGNPDSYGGGIARVERIETHGALVFLAGEEVFKIKRAVRFPYMDFSTLDLRRRACAREVEINQPQAPAIYLGLVPITRRPDGGLSVGGSGQTVEWAVHMRRFPGDALLSTVAARDGVDAALARGIADAVVDYHRTAAAGSDAQAPVQMQGIIDELAGALSAPRLGFDTMQVAGFCAACRRRLETTAALLEKRRVAGAVRRCHGDLHLANIVLWHGKPTLFDALEFDEALATIDVLYDLAFLLMDLDRHGQRAAANLVLNRYLWRTQDIGDIEGLAALPLFLALRAGIRAMVTAQRWAQAGQPVGSPQRATADTYLETAAGYLFPPPPRLIAVGGVSGTGKSTLAAGLAPLLGPAPGALHLRSDLERKAMLGRAETERLPAECYTADVTRQVYGRLLVKARVALIAGHAVIVDAAHLQTGERQAVEALAPALGIAFQGLWLTAPADLLIERVQQRRGDASDATPEVLRQQLSRDPDGGAWARIDASATPAEALRMAIAATHPAIDVPPPLTNR